MNAFSRGKLTYMYSDIKSNNRKYKTVPDYVEYE